MPEFRPGDTVRVSLKVVEGERERIQAFEGVCIARKNAGINSNFTLRKISYGEGVERVFPLYSPRITAIEVVRAARCAAPSSIICAAAPARRRASPSAPATACARSTAPARTAGGDDNQSEEIAIMATPRTLFDKIWDSHVVAPQGDGTCLLYIDRHLVHEVTSPQAFEGLKLAGRKVRRPDATLAVADHNVPTTDRSAGIAGIDEPESRLQVETLERNVKEFGVPYFPIDSIPRASSISSAPSRA